MRTLWSCKQQPSPLDLVTTGAAAPMTKTTTTTTVTGTESALVHFRVDYKEFTEFPIGESLHSDVVTVGGQLWRIDLYPRGIRRLHQYTSIFLRHLTKSNTSSIKAIFEPFFLRKDGSPYPKITMWASVHEHSESDECGDPFNTDDLGYPEFYHTYALERYVVDGHITFVCAIVVLNVLGPVPVPPQEISSHLGHLLETKEETSDVSFLVDGETIHAHRAVLAARSPVFKAQLFGSMMEATAMKSVRITLHEIASATFTAMLRFIYTDDWPGDGDLENIPFEMLQDLLAAADRYALDRLKLMCVRKLWECVSADTVLNIFACAETYGCLQLKKKCLDFCMSTEGYALLELRFPFLTNIREGAYNKKEKIDTEMDHTKEEDSSSTRSGSSSSEDEGSSSDDVGEQGDDDYDDNEDDDEELITSASCSRS